MAKHSWTNRTVPPLVVVAVIGCVWYALQNRPSTPIAVSASEPSATSIPTGNKRAVNDAQVTPATIPTVKKLGTEVQFSLSPTAYKHVQKVEFYVENQFVGTAYSQPYSVAVSENNLTAGTHTVTAKVYMVNNSATQTQPATFTAQPVTPPAPAIDSTDSSTTATMPSSSDSPSSSTVPAKSTVATPNNITGSPSDDGTSIILTWDASDGAVSYQIWRDGNQIGISSTPNYVDTSLSPGYTYDYMIVAVDSNGNTSNPSDAVGVTTSTPTSTPPPDQSEDLAPQTQTDTTLE